VDDSPALLPAAERSARRVRHVRVRSDPIDASRVGVGSLAAGACLLLLARSVGRRRPAQASPRTEFPSPRGPTGAAIGPCEARCPEMQFGASGRPGWSLGPRRAEVN
jgi:hypothetical protein